jgi:nuclear RNA export factor
MTDEDRGGQRYEVGSGKQHHENIKTRGFSGDRSFERKDNARRTYNRGRGRPMGGDGMNTDDRLVDGPGPNNNNNQQMQFDNETIKLEVSGFDQNTNMNDVIGFLKSKKQFHYKEVEQGFDNYRKQPTIVFTFERRSDALTVKQLSGIRHNNKKLFVKFLGTKGPNANQVLSPQMQTQMLHKVISAHYHTEAKLLNLNSINLEQAQIHIDFNNPAHMRNLLRAIKDTCSGVKSLGLANNQIRTLSGFAQLGQFAPELENISFEHNVIENIKELDNLKEIKVRELIFKDNPITANPMYRTEVSVRFPTLKYLDKDKVQPLIEFNVPELAQTVVIPPIKPESFYDDPSRKDFAINFLKKFIEIYDSGNRALLEVYVDDSIFTMTAANSSAVSSFKQFKKGNKDSLQDYIVNSRNLIKVTDAEQRAQKVAKGRLDIVHFLKSLPHTMHDLNSFVLDEFLIKNTPATVPLLSVTLHGHFWEKKGLAEGINRSFDRTFILAPSQSASKAAQMGWPAVIVNEMYNVKAYLGVAKPAEQPQTAAPIMPAAPTTLAATSLAPQQGLDVMQKSLVEKLMFITKLKQFFAVQCLEQVKWNYEAALNLYYEAEKSGRISREMKLDG